MQRDKSFYLPELDGLRFFAFLAVFTCHAALPISHLDFTDRPGLRAVHAILRTGSFGVDLFFLLGAFLITGILLREIEAIGRVDILNFYIHRVLRIWPLYFGFLSLLLISGAALPRSFYVSNALFVGDFYFSTFALWSISVEEQFYLVWPVVVRLCPTRDGLIAVAAILWLSAITGRYVFSDRVDSMGLWFNSLSHLDSIAAGVLLSVIGAHLIVVPRGVSVGVAAMLWLISSWLSPFGFGRDTLLAFAMVAPGSLCFVAAALGSGGFLRWEPVVYLGRISYGLYIFHNAILRTCIQVKGLNCLTPVCALAMTIIVASVSYKYFEMPFLRLKAHFQRVRSGPIEVTTQTSRLKALAARSA